MRSRARARRDSPPSHNPVAVATAAAQDRTSRRAPLARSKLRVVRSPKRIVSIFSRCSAVQAYDGEAEGCALEYSGGVGGADEGEVVVTWPNLPPRRLIRSVTS